MLTQRSGRSGAIIGMLFVMFVWGSSFAVTKRAVQVVPPMTFAFLRFLVASVCLHVMLMSRRTGKKQVGGQVSRTLLFWMGLTGVGFFYIFFNYSLLYTTASMGALIQAFIPVVIAILAAVFLNEQITLAKGISIVLSIAGVVLVAFVSKAGLNAPKPVLGNIFMLISVVAWAVYTILSKKIAHLDSLKVTCYSTYIGTLLLVPSMVVELWYRPLPIIDAASWVAIVYLGALGSAVSYFLYNYALKKLPASLVGVFINLDPVIGAGIAVVFLKEQLSLWQVVGGMLVLGGMWLSVRRQKSVQRPGPKGKGVAT